jgi:F-type H+-transporting ATPase subunit delta
MADTTTTARPYARAAFAYANEHKRLAQWSAWLAVVSLVVEDPKAHELLGNPNVQLAPLVEWMASIASEAGKPIDGEGRNFLSVLAENRRLSYLPEIAREFEQLKAMAENTVHAHVTTAMALTAEQRTVLQQALAKRFQKTIEIHETVDAGLIGGAVVRVEDFVVDGSLTSRLARLEQQMSEA